MAVSSANGTQNVAEAAPTLHARTSESGSSRFAKRWRRLVHKVSVVPRRSCEGGSRVDVAAGEGGAAMSGGVADRGDGAGTLTERGCDVARDMDDWRRLGIVRAGCCGGTEEEVDALIAREGGSRAMPMLSRWLRTGTKLRRASII